MLLVYVCCVCVYDTFTLLIFVLFRSSLKALKMAKNAQTVNFQYKIDNFAWRVLWFCYFVAIFQCLPVEQQNSRGRSDQPRFSSAVTGKKCSKTVFSGLRPLVPGYKKGRRGNCRSLYKTVNISSIVTWFLLLGGSCYSFLKLKNSRKTAKISFSVTCGFMRAAPRRDLSTCLLPTGPCAPWPHARPPPGLVHHGPLPGALALCTTAHCPALCLYCGSSAAA